MNTEHERMQKTLRTMRENAPKGSLGSGTSHAAVEQVVRQLGVALPDSYQEFLIELGYAEWPDYMYGILAGLSPGLTLASRVELERTHPNLRLPHHMVPFSDDGWGNLYCLDTSQMNDGECPVVLWHHEDTERQTPKQLHPTFAHWLEEIVTEELSSMADTRRTSKSSKPVQPADPTQKRLPLD